MEKRMERSLIYNGTITAEQFLFYEIRIASKYYLDGTTSILKRVSSRSANR